MADPPEAIEATNEMSMSGENGTITEPIATGDLLGICSCIGYKGDAATVPDVNDKLDDTIEMNNDDATTTQDASELGAITEIDVTGDVITINGHIQNANSAVRDTSNAARVQPIHVFKKPLVKRMGKKITKAMGLVNRDKKKMSVRRKKGKMLVIVKKANGDTKIARIREIDYSSDEDDDEIDNFTDYDNETVGNADFINEDNDGTENDIIENVDDVISEIPNAEDDTGNNATSGEQNATTKVDATTQVDAIAEQVADGKMDATIEDNTDGQVATNPINAIQDGTAEDVASAKVNCPIQMEHDYTARVKGKGKRKDKVQGVDKREKRKMSKRQRQVESLIKVAESGDALVSEEEMMKMVMKLQKKYKRAQKELCTSCQNQGVTKIQTTVKLGQRESEYNMQMYLFDLVNLAREGMGTVPSRYLN